VYRHFVNKEMVIIKIPGGVTNGKTGTREARWGGALCMPVLGAGATCIPKKLERAKRAGGEWFKV